MLAHGGPLIVFLLIAALGIAMLAGGFLLVLTSKTDHRWLIGAGICLLALPFCFLLFRFSGGVSKILGLE